MTSSLTSWSLYWTAFAVVGQVKSTPGTTVIKPPSLSGQPNALSMDPYVETAQHADEEPVNNIILQSDKTSAYANEFSDPHWENQWYMHDYRTKSGPVMDHNIVPVYRMGFHGEGIKISVLDDGFELDHPDLKPNILKRLSFDVCRHNPNPWADRNVKSVTNSHGTRVAGIIAMPAKNKYCGVGIAHGAKIGVIKTWCQNTNENVEALSLARNQELIDISNNSWGPEDDGRSLDRANQVSEKALHKGLKHGRGKKGVIFVFPSGNGRHRDDNCGWDQMVNQHGVIVITAATNQGKVTFYGERCAGVLATTYSGAGTPDTEGVVAPDVDKSCVNSFFGTSAAVPIASGIFALVLQANSSLTYRDVMHIVTMGSEVAPLADNADTWYRNGKGFWVSNDFGFGLLNAKNMVDLALSWQTVPDEKVCKFTIQPDVPIPLSAGEIATISFETDACQDTADEVNYLETVEVYATVEYPYRGYLSMFLNSPSKTGITLLENRINDNSQMGLEGWRVKATHYWGENPRGSWTIEVLAASSSPGWRAFFGSGRVKHFTFAFRGTATPPHHYGQLPRKYASFRLPNGQTSENK